MKKKKKHLLLNLQGGSFTLVIEFVTQSPHTCGAQGGIVTVTHLAVISYFIQAHIYKSLSSSVTKTKRRERTMSKAW